RIGVVERGEQQAGLLTSAGFPQDDKNIQCHRLQLWELSCRLGRALQFLHRRQQQADEDRDDRDDDEQGGQSKALGTSCGGIRHRAPPLVSRYPVRNRNRALHQLTWLTGNAVMCPTASALLPPE